MDSKLEKALAILTDGHYIEDKYRMLEPYVPEESRVIVERANKARIRLNPIVSGVIMSSSKVIPRQEVRHLKVEALGLMHLNDAVNVIRVEVYDHRGSSDLSNDTTSVIIDMELENFSTDHTWHGPVTYRFVKDTTNLSHTSSEEEWSEEEEDDDDDSEEEEEEEEEEDDDSEEEDEEEEEEEEEEDNDSEEEAEEEEEDEDDLPAPAKRVKRTRDSLRKTIYACIDEYMERVLKKPIHQDDCSHHTLMASGEPISTPEPHRIKVLVLSNHVLEGSNWTIDRLDMKPTEKGNRLVLKQDFSSIYSELRPGFEFDRLVIREHGTVEIIRSEHATPDKMYTLNLVGTHLVDQDLTTL